MIEAINVFLIFCVIFFGIKIVKSYFTSTKTGETRKIEDLTQCGAEEPFYIILVTTTENTQSWISEIIDDHASETAFVVIHVNDVDPASDYTKRTIQIVRALFDNIIHLEHHHPLLIFKTNKKYRKSFSKFFPEICVVKTLNDAKDLTFHMCPGL